MKLNSVRQGSNLTLKLSGEIDHHSAREIMSAIDEKLESSPPRDCVIDMEKVSFMDSSGIAIILKTYRTVNAAGGRLWIENVPAQPMRVLDASGIDRIIKISALN